MLLLIFSNQAGIATATATIPGQHRILPVSGAGSRYVAEVVNLVATGKANWTGTVTLTANAASTRVVDNRVTTASIIVFVPTTANAASASAPYVASADYSDGEFVATHANDANADKTYKYLVLN